MFRRPIEQAAPDLRIQAAALDETPPHRPLLAVAALEIEEQAGDHQRRHPGDARARPSAGRFLPYLLPSIAVHVAIGCAVLFLGRRDPPSEAVPVVIHFKLFPPMQTVVDSPGTNGPPAEKPPQGRPAAASTLAPRPPTVAKVARSSAAPSPHPPLPDPSPSSPSPDPPGAQEASVPPGASASGTSGGSGSAGGGATGLASLGSPSPGGAPIPARPADLASVHAGIGRTLEYPRAARWSGLQGRTTLRFVLLADGNIRDLVIRESSGSAILDQAALAAVERAAPFPAPGVAVSIAVPVVFRLQGPG